MIPFVDLKAQYLNIENEIDQAIRRVINKTAFIGGEEVQLFEEDFRRHLGVKYCIACANGTDSLEILLKAMGIGSGDEVLVPALSWISTSEAVSTVGATPVFVDIEPDYYTIDVRKIETAITKYTKAIIPVHLYGHPANMTEIMRLASKYQLKVLEDCAQAHDAEWDGVKVGIIGDAGSFSFYPGKNLGAYGDAGAMVTGDDELAEKVRMIANHGQIIKHDHQIEGRNSRMDGLQAAILRVKLPHLKKWTENRIELARIYSKEINSNHFIIPKIHPLAKHVFHLYVIQTNERTSLRTYLSKAGISSAIHYPKGLPFLACYNHRGYTAKTFPVVNDVQDRIVSLPMFSELRSEQQSIIINALNSF